MTFEEFIEKVKEILLKKYGKEFKNESIWRNYYNTKTTPENAVRYKLIYCQNG